MTINNYIIYQAIYDHKGELLSKENIIEYLKEDLKELKDFLDLNDEKEYETTIKELQKMDEDVLKEYLQEYVIEFYEPMNIPWL